MNFITGRMNELSDRIDDEGLPVNLYLVNKKTDYYNEYKVLKNILNELLTK